MLTSGIHAALLLSAGIDGSAALGHASRLAALGPHPFGSPRTALAAEYVAAEFREAGLGEVRVQRFERDGLVGANIIAVLRGASSESVVVAAHHDSGPESPGAWSAAAVGVLIEMARTLAATGARSRTLVFVCWDAEGGGPRLYLDSLGPGARDVVGVLSLEGAGWREGRPALHTPGAEQRVQPGSAVFPPGWLVRSALEGADDAGAPLSLGQRFLGWVYQPVVRLARVRRPVSPLAGSDTPSLVLWDASPWRPYPYAHTPADTADKLDADALAAFGVTSLAVVQKVAAATRGAADDRWFALGEHVFVGVPLLALGAASLLPGLLLALGWGPLLVLRVLHAALFGVLLWRHAPLACALLVLPNLFVLFPRRSVWMLVVLIPMLCTGVGLASASAQGGTFFEGLWLAPWELVVAGAAVATGFLRPPVAPKRRRRGRRA
jgi:hypothetical protein